MLRALTKIFSFWELYSRVFPSTRLEDFRLPFPTPSGESVATSLIVLLGTRPPVGHYHIPCRCITCSWLTTLLSVTSTLHIIRRRLAYLHHECHSTTQRRRT